MKVYIATSFKAKEDFHVVKQLLEQNGHVVTHDWTLDDTSIVKPERLQSYLSLCAARCLVGLHEADVLILIARPNMAGAFVELGFAFASSKPVVVLDAFLEGNQQPIFYHIPNCEAFQHARSFDEMLLILGKSESENVYDRVVKINPNSTPDDN